MSGWLYSYLQTHLPEEQWEQVEPFLYAESWASPSARQRDWYETEKDFPLRFHLDIDMKV